MCGGGYPLLVRWITDFDCGYETSFWYVIKDNVYDIQALKAKRRYEITKGRKNFEVKIISPMEYCEILYNIQIAAFNTYPAKYRPIVKHDEFILECKEWNGVCFGAFLKDKNGIPTSELCGYSYLMENGKCINFSIQKVSPKYERDGVNAALVDGILTYYTKEIGLGKYICDGAKTINHETAFQDYLEKYFGFRKAYCKLNIIYRPIIRWIIPIIFVFRKMLKRLDNIGIIHLANSVLIMEEIKRKQSKD